MEPAHFRFGGGAADTMMHPLVAVAMVATIMLIFMLPRKQIILPFLVTTFLVPFGQVLVVGGIHFMVYRILVLAGLARLLFSKLSTKTVAPTDGFNGIDRAFAWCAVFSALTFVFLWMDSQALINKLGVLLDALGGYFFLRFLIQDKEDVRRTIKVFAFIAGVMAAFMVYEQVAFRNLFGLLGGVGLVPAVREGRIRSQGSFSVYVTAGAFGATLLPLFVWLWKSGESKLIAIFGLISSTLVTVTSDTSTAEMAYAAGILGLCFWPLRRQMRRVRWVLVITLVGLHLVMKAPVWALIGRVDLTGSSSGYQRYLLVDSCIRHFFDWCLIGAKDYDKWGSDMFDVSNQYVAYAETGGLVSLAFFLAVISRSFGRIGTARQCAAGDRKQEWFLWALGAALLAHVFAFFGISYFDQTQVAWYALLALISAATAAWVAQQEGKAKIESVNAPLSRNPAPVLEYPINAASLAPDPALGSQPCSGQQGLRNQRVPVRL